MTKPVGGRGIKAPYESTHVRVPMPIKKEVQALIDEFREREFKQVKPLTSLEEDEIDQDDESDRDTYEYSEDEIIKSQAKMLQECRLEIESLNRQLEKLNLLTTLDEAKDSARSILRSKKSASQSLVKLLTSIYQIAVTLEDLK